MSRGPWETPAVDPAVFALQGGLVQVSCSPISGRARDQTPLTPIPKPSLFPHALKSQPNTEAGHSPQQQGTWEEDTLQENVYPSTQWAPLARLHLRSPNDLPSLDSKPNTEGTSHSFRRRLSSPLSIGVPWKHQDVHHSCLS